MTEQFPDQEMLPIVAFGAGYLFGGSSELSVGDGWTATGVLIKA